MTAADALAEAERAERIANDCGPLDPAYRFFRMETDAWLREAARRELSEQSN